MKIVAAPGAPARPAPQVPSGKIPAPPPSRVFTAAPPPAPRPAAQSAAPPRPAVGSTMMLEPDQIVTSQPESGEATVQFSANMLPSQASAPPAPSARSFDAPVLRAPSPYAANAEATRMLDIPVRPSMQMPIVANNDATRMFDVPVRVSGAHAAVPNNESTRIIDNINAADLIASLGKKSGGGPAAESSGTTEKAASDVGKGNRKKPVADVKLRSKLKVTPLDPGRLLVQQEAAEQRRGEATMMGSLDKFLEKSGMMKVGAGLSDDLPQEGTMVGKFLGFVGLGEKSGAMVAPIGKDPVEETWEAVRAAPLLNGLNPQFVTDAIKAGDVTLLNLGRDMLIDMNGKAVLVVEGQIAMARFKPDVLDHERRAQAAYKPGDKKGEKREMKRRQEVGPIIRMCETNLGLFNEGDLVSIEARGDDATGLAVYSVTPIRALTLSLARLETWRRTYQFFGDRIRRAADAARSRLAASTGARSLVADFFVRHGLSVSMSLRVRELDKCIECYECEKACEQRYGVKRLSLNGKVLGALDFVDCCHTCVDQRCIDPCAYDAIKFDDDKKEVIILEDTCIGCSLCALACPYDAIEMHELDAKPLLQLRLQKESKLEFGDGKARKAKLRRIASKCDHCVNYEDQACISACPTSALLEIPPEAAFTERTDSMAEAAKKGFERTVMFDANQIFDPKKFYKGLSEEDDKAKKAETKFRAGWLWLIGLLGFFGCLAEIVLRKFWPDLSLLYYLQMRQPGMDADMALANVEFRVGDPFALWMGYVGTVVMFSSTLYSAHKWIPGIKKLGSQRAWFDYHVWSGTVGPLLVMLHTAAKLDNWVSLAIYAMLATVISGVVGRYLSTELPDLASQAALQVVEYERKLTDLRNRHAGVNVADRFYEKLKRYYGRVANPKMSGFRAGMTALWMLLRDSLARPFRASLLRYRLRGIKDQKARTKTAFVATELALFERRRVLYPKIEPMFHEWKIVHIPFSIALTILSGIHIVIELLR
jgi:Fe-S-cluster-containing hydrogenase component 2